MYLVIQSLIGIIPSAPARIISELFNMQVIPSYWLGLSVQAFIRLNLTSKVEKLCRNLLAVLLMSVCRRRDCAKVKSAELECTYFKVVSKSMSAELKWHVDALINVNIVLKARFLLIIIKF